MKHPGLQNQERVRVTALRLAQANTQLRMARERLAEAKRQLLSAEQELECARNARVVHDKVLDALLDADQINDFGLPLIRTNFGLEVPGFILEYFPEIARQMEEESRRVYPAETATGAD